MISKRIVLHFPHRLVDQPIVCNLVKDYELEFNILKAYVTPREEGLLVLELSGEDKNYEQGIQYLREAGVKVQPLSQDIIRNEERCTHCGVCVPICPTGALVVEPLTRKVNFYDNKCIACELCVKACPVRAMEVHF
ncbi:MAG: (Fe-S)-binding protein [bacterium (Candidatus Ratteibacteria) CG_4_10_14_3_um_filter_41_18]|uniref:(Fe-S)-binding protein n=4 Tax=Candidatus Ratteibacteria TaxID=2979319 RepID=A0A2M7E7S2_9BACT|nr:MAG: (Fe-S)-binding protein [bacterium (Candidatus Ratteibacteria) CG01_land_8_20_14_3_00_40_19]PIW32808.1 MAG: (Fe-S)-binding protein [bacterium (Candidatus Ratteibacteria) CG15_BIG_FIL_POST_REV_8_21_14_020_41_12]PIX76674.1 MAG: (Fe-S)-binding protein [bacterium (Candidatus Ratteibacteria) CG_4_10_14_3_um_filter_41_18]PJA62427.1 MAG: (Fe-S)-binding protein [bacterium (Candidatus Ratteibacteria) CG_4_9_14_3_um_filter_41_21]